MNIFKVLKQSYVAFYTYMQNKKQIIKYYYINIIFFEIVLLNTSWHRIWIDIDVNFSKIVNKNFLEV